MKRQKRMLENYLSFTARIVIDCLRSCSWFRIPLASYPCFPFKFYFLILHHIRSLKQALPMFDFALLYTHCILKRYSTCLAKNVIQMTQAHYFYPHLRIAFIIIYVILHTDACGRQVVIGSPTSEVERLI